jgi:hypothetical protein
MSSKVCDRTPCTRLSVTLRELRANMSAPGRIQLLVLRGDTRYYPPEAPPVLMSLEYCPFCGTRIEPSWLLKLYRGPL